ncbi:hypothetical protein DFQ28_009973 [Apophysomyces sp. BC1034]|nr:hypothetical protein DFQ30_009542 [Apophysomyces sp. BC1015]KAG0172238.1 hypothetical protein DFQ29_008471 [Apophysomyces sp. BC1021]KAG0185087.1 hypothetical protein DFQ28_009973 [Apophysomyces sp. BC1034]
MGSGTFVSKANVNKFSKLLELDLVQNGFSDAYFLTYMNQVPYQLEGHGSTDQYALSDDEKVHMHKGLVTLYHSLQHKNDIFPTNEEQPNMYKHDARTACRDDRCLFLTNVEAFPDVRLFSYNPSISVDDSERIHTDYFDQNKFISHPYSSAVDGDDKSAWKGPHNIKAGDYIGLDMLRPMPIALNYRVLTQHPYAYRRTLSVQISNDGVDWTEVRTAAPIACHAFDTKDAQENVPDLLECRFSIKETRYRFMRLESKRDLNFGFKVYDISFSAKAKRDVNGQLLEIVADEDGVFFVEDKDE